MNDPANAGADDAPVPVDLAGVDPIHWAEARRRVTILREWCAVKRHSRAQCVDAAARMGVSIKHFERLVVTWKRFGETRRVCGSASRRGDARGSRTMPAATRAAIDDAIAELGPTARFIDLLADVNHRCREACTPAASYGMVHYVRMRTAPGQVGSAFDETREVRIARVSCILPVAFNGRTEPTPELVLAVSAPDGLILAHHVAFDGDLDAAAAEVVADIAGMNDNASVLVAANIADAVERTGLIGNSTDAYARLDRANGSELLTALLGSHIDSIPIRHRRGARLRKWPAKPLDPDDAMLAINEAVAAHNRQRQTSLSHVA